jgi:nicotinamidase-related amidase
MARPNSLLLIVDMLTDYGFPDADRVLDGADSAVAAIRRARDVADDAGILVSYANDIHEDWRCSRDEICKRALSGARPDLVRPLLPRSQDAFMFKGQHSAFYGTPLAHLLHQEKVTEIVLTGQVTEQCVLYTALDAHVRDYPVALLTDAVLSIDQALGDAAHRMMTSNLGARSLTTRQWAEEVL